MYSSQHKHYIYPSDCPNIRTYTIIFNSLCQATEVESLVLSAWELTGKMLLEFRTTFCAFSLMAWEDESAREGNAPPLRKFTVSPGVFSRRSQYILRTQEFSAISHFSSLDGIRMEALWYRCTWSSWSHWATVGGEKSLWIKFLVFIPGTEFEGLDN